MRYYSRSALDVALANEAETCKGCAHEAIVFSTKYCAKKRLHGSRCKFYLERAPGG